MAFMPFITAGDPDVPSTLRLIRELASRSVDLIEVGFPYSDPIADGPVIQASYTRALKRGLHVDDIFAGIETLAGEDIPPLVAMVSYAIVFRADPAHFIARAKSAGFSGFIIPDLPADESADVAALVRSHGLDLIQLISPTTSPDRAARILKIASGFVYCISVAGTTGERAELPAALTEQLKALGKQTDLPLAVGFGISKPEQVNALRGLADGIIVGSAIVRQMESLSSDATTSDQTLSNIGDFAASMVAAVKG